MDLASPAVSGTSVYADGLITYFFIQYILCERFVIFRMDYLD